MEEIRINEEYIKLGQLLKLVGAADSGVHAKILILNGEVKVNDEVETRRGKKIHPGDIINVTGYGDVKII